MERSMPILCGRFAPRCGKPSRGVGGHEDDEGERAVAMNLEEEMLLGEEGGHGEEDRVHGDHAGGEHAPERAGAGEFAIVHVVTCPEEGDGGEADGEEGGGEAVEDESPAADGGEADDDAADAG